MNQTNKKIHDNIDLGETLEIALATSQEADGDIKLDKVSSELSLVPEYDEVVNKMLADFDSEPIEDNTQTKTIAQLYRAEAAKYPLLSKDEEIELAKEVEKGNKKAIEKLANSNLRLVLSNASKYGNYGIEMNDLIQDGMEGLMKAVNKYDYRKGFRFSTYATWWILQRIRKTVSDRNAMIKTPAYIISKASKLAAVENDFCTEHKRLPTMDELVELTGLTPKAIKNLRNIPSCSLVLDAPTSDDSETTVGDFVKDDSGMSTEEQYEFNLLSEQISEIVSELSYREQFVIKHYFGLDGGDTYNLQEIGDMLGITRERARQIKNDALATISQFHIDY